MGALNRRRFGKWVLRGGLLVPFQGPIIRAATILRGPNVGTVAAGGGGGDVAYRSSAHVVGTGTNATPSEPSGAAQNDIFLAMFHCESAGTPGLPASWTSLDSGTDPFDGFFDYIVGWIRRGASAPDLTFTTGSSVYREVFVHAISGAKTSGSPVDVDEFATASTTNPDPPSATIVTSPTVAFAFGVHWSGSGGGGWTAPSGYTIRGNNTAGNNTFNASKAVAVTGAENPAVFTGAGGANNLFVATIVIAD